MKINEAYKAIRNSFAHNQLITRKELYDALHEGNPDLKKTTFGWIIYELNKAKHISTIKKGVYTLGVKSEYFPEISDKLKRIYTSVKRKGLSDNLSIWSSSWLNEFMVHQAMSSKIILEVDPDVLESVYYFIKDNVYKKVFINPDEKVIHQYISGESESLILLPIIGRSPLKHINKITIPKLEKILVDVFSNTILYYWLQGQEFINIFTNACERYQINFSILFSYASRRGTDKKLKDFLLDKTDIPEELIG